MKRLIVTTVCLVLCAFAGAQQVENRPTENGQHQGRRMERSKVEKETFVYAVKGTDTLRLDRYTFGPTRMVDGQAGRTKPCLIFMFGGGFVGGSRDAEGYISYFEYFARRGFVVASIDYRLGLRPLATGEISADGLGAREFLGLFEKTINMAVEDLYSATAFLIDNATEWGINPALIITSGSSAGAISVLQGEYERANGSEVARVLPEGFRYAGVMSFAGAIYSNHGHLKWASQPAPLLLFHGDADRNVPYGKKKVFKYGFFGSEYIAKKYDKAGFPYWFWSEENADHRIAGVPMTDNLTEMESFIRNYVFEGEKMQTIQTVKYLDHPKVKKRFGIKDYIGANFPE
jgi:predicted esterase